jgi:hypothetical protein
MDNKEFLNNKVNINNSSNSSTQKEEIGEESK